ncbi:hypothetical protein AB0E81_39560 [Streptomyces sp. NPDC033538]|uniref:hypothetical protein n=1 Tax=Streptomyces sp. NPDC033538 TaxID=3155367 RepID=UPI0033EDD0FB
MAADHLAALLDQLRGIVSDGIATGDFAQRGEAATARGRLRGHHRLPPPRARRPVVSGRIDTHYEAVCTLTTDGLRTR